MVDGWLMDGWWIWRFPEKKKTVPPRYPFIHGIFHGINHPAIDN